MANSQFPGLDGFRPVNGPDGNPLSGADESKAMAAYGEDPSNALADGTHKQQKLMIYHIPTGETIAFKAYIEGYSDQYTSEFSEEVVYGRMDPIVQYQGTKRVISLDWVVPAYSPSEAQLNHEKCAALFSMMYPLYDGGADVSNANTISVAPVFKIKFGNLITDPKHRDTDSAEEGGLVGTITGFTYSPDFEQGFVDGSGGNLLPKAHKLSIEFTVLHTHGLGFDNYGRKRESKYPYGDGAASSAGGGGGPTGIPEVDEAAESGVTGG